MSFIKKLAKTVIFVTFFSCIERGLGFIYRIFMSRAIGAEGLGLYQIALSVIGLLMTVSASGIPITVSRLMIKERAANVKFGESATVTAGLIATVCTCLPVIMILFLLKNKLGVLFADERSVTLFLIILPGVLLTSVYAVIRGFFWGRKYFYTYSVIELGEEAIMIIVGIILILLQKNVYDKTKAAAYAVLISYVFSFSAAIITFFIKKGKFKNPSRVIKPLIISSTPITLMRTATALSGFLIAIILPASLIASGVPKSEAVSGFGIISGMTMPLLFIPSTVIGSLSLVLVPELAENFYKKQSAGLQNNVEKSLLYSAIIAVFIIPVFCGTGKFIGSFVYDNELSGTYLSYAAPIMLPMSITMISNSLLNSMGMERRTLLYFGIGSAFLILSVWILPPYVGNFSLIIGYFANYCVTAFLNVRLLQKICCKQLAFKKKLLKCISGSVPAIFLSLFLFNVISKFIAPLFAFCLSTTITTSCLYLTLCALDIFDINKLTPRFTKTRRKYRNNLNNVRRKNI